MPAARTLRPGKIDSSASNGAAAGGFHPIRWVRRLFTRPLKLKRVGLQVHVVFDASRLEVPNSKTLGRGESLRQGYLALQSLLAQHDDARHVVPHLSHLEHTLARNGSRALTSLPLKLLQRAMDQLDMIEGTARGEALMALRVRVDEAVRRRTPVNMKGDIANIEVRDASPSQFDEAEVHWTNRMELDAISSGAVAIAK
jgi:hypothetical protein